jgi:hypothetical protein
MRVWTNGALHVARSSRGLFVLRGSQVVRFIELPGEEARGLLAVNAEGTHAWVEGLRRVSLEDGAVDGGGREAPLDLLGTEDGLAALLPSSSGARLALGSPDGVWSRAIDLAPTAVVRTQFPSSIGAAVSWPWADAPALDPAALRLRRAPAGLAVVCRRSGLLGILRAEGPLRWFQAPSGAQGLLDAVPTATGLLISLRVGDEGVTAHFSEDGRCQGHTGLTLRSIGAASLAGDRFVVFDGAKSRLKVFGAGDCQDLHPRSRLTLPAPPLDVASSLDGRWVIFSDPTAVSIFELGDKRLSLVASLVPESVLRESSAKVREKQRIEQGGHYKRTDGPASLGFPASKAPIPPWEAPPGEALALALSLRSTGGAGQGIAVELSGPALDQGLVEPHTVEFEGLRAPLVKQGNKWGCTLPEVEIPQGMSFPFDPKPKTPEQSEKAQALLAATHLPFRVHLTAKTLGAAMLSVATWPLQGPSSPMKWTRLLAVRHPPPPAPPEPTPEQGS